MLGLRLDPDLEGRLDRFASEQRRTRSDIAREAVREYLDRHSLEVEMARELEIIAENTTEEELAWLDAAHEDLMASEPPYDWGDEKE